MIDFESELKKILSEDPLGLLKNRTAQPITADQRLKDSFEEINKFIDKNGNVKVSDQPGLGVKYDWEYIEKNKLQKLVLD